VLLAAAVGADFDAVDDLAAAGAAGVAGADAAAGAAVVAGAGAAASDAGLVFDPFWTPPWPLHAPRPVAVEVVPSLQVVADPDAAGDAGAAAADAAGDAVVLTAFWTPPWPLHAPRPVAVEVVPSLQVVGVLESAAYVGSAKPNTIKCTASNPISFVFLMKCHSPGLFG